jgi:hypothetical protein
LSPAAIEVGLAQRERFVDAKTGPPEHDDESAQPPAVEAVAGDAHDRDALLNGGRVGWIAQAFVARRVTGVKAGHRRRRPSTAGGIKNNGSGHGLCRGYGRQANRSPQTRARAAPSGDSCSGHRAKAPSDTTGGHGRC